MGADSLDMYTEARIRARRTLSIWLRWRERRLVALGRRRTPCNCELARLAAARAELRDRAEARRSNT